MGTEQVRSLLAQAQDELVKLEAAAAQTAIPDWVADFLNRRVKVENFLFACAMGTRPLPDKQQCRELALQLGVPESFGASAATTKAPRT